MFSLNELCRSVPELSKMILYRANFKLMKNYHDHILQIGCKICDLETFRLFQTNICKNQFKAPIKKIHKVAKWALHRWVYCEQSLHALTVMKCH